MLGGIYPDYSPGTYALSKNVSDTITVTGKGSITYTYDVAGIRINPEHNQEC